MAGDGLETSEGLPDFGGLRERIAQLTEMPERFGVDRTRGPFLHAMVQRMSLLKQMIDRIGIDDARGPLVSAILWQAEWACLDCASAAKCTTWLGNRGDDDAYREFCSNAALFDILPHREQVSQSLPDEHVAQPSL
jgi:hypothetical protein